MYAYEIDTDGFIINNYLTIGDAPIPEGCITAQLPQSLPFYKSKWDGKGWTEGATQEEIDEIIGVTIPSPTIEQRTSDLEDIVNMLIIGGI